MWQTGERMNLSWGCRPSCFPWTRRGVIAAATQSSPRTKSAPASRKALAEWVASLPGKEKNGLLVRLMEEEDSRIGMELSSRFSRHLTVQTPAAELPHRTVAELLAAAGIE